MVAHGTYSRYANHGCKCDECRGAAREYCQERWQKNKKRLGAEHRAYYQKNKERLIAYSKKNWERRRDERAGRVKPDACEVCGSDGRVVLDHDHRTGDSRGWLCDGCNLALGKACDSPDVLRKLADYLEER